MIKIRLYLEGKDASKLLEQVKFNVQMAKQFKTLGADIKVALFEYQIVKDK